jgi:hypothetical protein
MDAALAELSDTGLRKQKIDRQKFEKQKELDALHFSHTREGGGTGSGRWDGADQKKKDKLEADLKHLQQGKFPSEVAAAARASAEALRNGMRQNTQHHTGGLAAPSGRVPSQRNGGGGGGGSSATGGGGGGGGSGMVDADTAARQQARRVVRASLPPLAMR